MGGWSDHHLRGPVLGKHPPSVFVAKKWKAWMKHRKFKPIIPIGSIKLVSLDICSYICHGNQPNVGKYKPFHTENLNQSYFWSNTLCVHGHWGWLGLIFGRKYFLTKYGWALLTIWSNHNISPRFPWNKGSHFPSSASFWGSCEVAIIWPESYSNPMAPYTNVCFNWMIPFMTWHGKIAVCFHQLPSMFGKIASKHTFLTCFFLNLVAIFIRWEGNLARIAPQGPNSRVRVPYGKYPIGSVWYIYFMASQPTPPGPRTPPQK